MSEKHSNMMSNQEYLVLSPDSKGTFALQQKDTDAASQSRCLHVADGKYTRLSW